MLPSILQTNIETESVRDGNENERGRRNVNVNVVIIRLLSRLAVVVIPLRLRMPILLRIIPIHTRNLSILPIITPTIITT
jgi:hypothetical protein